MEFKAWPKTPRLYKDIVITEKIDGTNACVVVLPVPYGQDEIGPDVIDVVEVLGDGAYFVGAQSRNRMITPANDNAGFATWVERNSRELVGVLGSGYHYGEWWGSGIQRGYGLTNGEKRFSLFNSHRWDDVELSDVPGLGVVPQLYHGPMGDVAIEDALDDLKFYGSQAAPGFMNPEGIIVYHTASRQTYKVTLNNDGHKGTNMAVV